MQYSTKLHKTGLKTDMQAWKLRETTLQPFSNKIQSRKTKNLNLVLAGISPELRRNSDTRCFCLISGQNRTLHPPISLPYQSQTLTVPEMAGKCSSELIAGCRKSLAGFCRIFQFF